MDTEYMKKMIFETVGFKYDGEIAVTEHDGVYAALKNGAATVGAADAAGLARAYFLFAKSASEGIEDFEIVQHRHIKEMGVMLDMSRNGVMKPEAVKKYINNLACLGMTYLMLYTEDTYEIKSRPHFGYMRGRYTTEELREMDSYAKSLGVELIPCIQTLGHLSQFLKWARESWDFRDTESVLCMEEEETYRFIEEEIAACREGFSTSKIHIGMDEAWDIGLGRWYEKHGFMTDKHEKLRVHISKVLEICRKYGFEPMMWNDMLFRAKAKNGVDYYMPDLRFTEEDMRGIEGVGMIYWDYNQSDEERLRGMLRATKSTGNEAIYADGIVPYMELLYNAKACADTASKSMKICMEEEINNVMITVWGDDGEETNVFYTLPFLPYFSENCYRGADCTEDDIQSISEFLTGIELSDSMAAMNMFQKHGEKEVRGKGLFYGDILYELGPDYEDCEFLEKVYSENAARMSECMKKYPDKREWFEYCYLLYKILADKAELRVNLRKRYREGDKEYLQNVCENTLPQIREEMRQLKELWRKQWYSTYKPYGFEVLLFRLSGMIERIDDCIKILGGWLSGETRTVDELEQELLPTYRITQKAAYFITPSNIF